LRRYFLHIEGVGIPVYDPEDGSSKADHYVTYSRICTTFDIHPRRHKHELLELGIELQQRSILGGQVAACLTLSDALFWLTIVRVNRRRSVQPLLRWQVGARIHLKELLREKMLQGEF